MDELEDRDFENYLETLIARGSFKGVALGIAKQAIDRGQASLSEKQMAVLDQVLVPYVIVECQLCGSGFEWAEMDDAWHNGSYHSHCNYNWEGVLYD